MPNVSQMFTSNKYLSAADLQGKAHKLIIQGITEEEIGDPKEKKFILNFVDKEKTLVLNKTNALMIAEQHGEETDNWQAKEIILYPTKTSFGGKPVDCIRVKAPEPVIADADDEIPF